MIGHHANVAEAFELSAAWEPNVGLRASCINHIHFSVELSLLAGDPPSLKCSTVESWRIEVAKGHHQLESIIYSLTRLQQFTSALLTLSCSNFGQLP